MKISLIHPSRGRAEKAKRTYDFWWENSSKKNRFQIEYILSLDESDNLLLYQKEFGDMMIFLINDNKSIVEAANEAAKFATGDILIYVSDDFKCPQEWDLSIQFIGQLLFPAILKVDDCLQPFNKKILTIPIMNRLAYEKLGYFFNPLYKSMWVDNDLYHTCEKNGIEIINRPDLKFPHEHHSIGRSENDEIYKRSEATFVEGKKIFELRYLDGFPI